MLATTTANVPRTAADALAALQAGDDRLSAGVLSQLTRWHRDRRTGLLADDLMDPSGRKEVATLDLALTHAALLGHLVGGLGRLHGTDDRRTADALALLLSVHRERAYSLAILAQGR